ncbi:MAG: SgcJ/EcaC family oxidoreductase [Acidobacteria bacterium]|nr:SgcJ/EcaC family oxidoreductase [Acidobacteriota bacterium]
MSVLVALVLAGAAPLPAVDLPPPLARVLTDYERAWQGHDPAALADLFAEDGLVLSNASPPVRGRAEIRKHYAAAGGPLSLRALAFATDGSTGYIIGGFAAHAGEPDTGKFTLTLRQEAGGRWVIVSDMDNGNSRPEPVVLGQVEKLHSTVLNEDRKYRIALPANYAAAIDRRYPVLYLLDGAEDFVHTASSAAFLAAHGEIPEMIVVGVDSTVRIRDFTQTDWSSHWIGGGGAANFKRFLSAELMPAIEGAYRTDGFRILSGHSAGGQFVLYGLASDPSLFRAYIALSPSLDWDDHLPQRSLQQSFKSARELKAFLYFARSDDSGAALADDEKLVDTLRNFAPQGFRWHSEAFPQETHGGMPLLAQIDALRQVYPGYLFHNDMLEKGIDFADAHFREVSKTIGWPLPVPELVINDLGYAALSNGKTEEAIALFKRNVSANPNSANACDSLADGYAKAERWKEAAEAEEKAAALAVEFKLPNQAYFADQAKKWRERLRQASAPTTP